MNPEFVEMLRALLNAEVRFLIVGAYALNVHTKPRATGDLNIWVEPTPENAGKLLRALKEFGTPLGQVVEADFECPGVTFQIGIAPLRIDILTKLTGIDFDDAWRSHIRYPFGPFEVPFLGKAALIRNKRATGRPKDLLDVESLEEC